MLHIYGKASHEIAFRKANGNYKWVGEQEICRGFRDYHSVNGNFKENVFISYFEHTAGQAEGLRIEYQGPEDRVGHEIPITTAKALLKSWGCE
jgi:hypothetical protein